MLIPTLPAHPALPCPALQVLERRGVATSSDEEAAPAAANGRDAAAPHKSKSTSALVAAASGSGGAGSGGQRAPGGALAAAAAKGAALRGGLEPELYHPEQLMGAGGGVEGSGESGSGAGGVGGFAQAAPPRPGLASISAGRDPEPAGKGGWFSNWFPGSNVLRGSADDAASDPGGADGSMLKRPPPVRSAAVEWCGWLAGWVCGMIRVRRVSCSGIEGYAWGGQTGRQAGMSQKQLTPAG